MKIGFKGYIESKAFYLPNITFDIVKANPDFPWNYEYLSENDNITFDIVKENPDLPWNYDYLSYNTNLTFDIVKLNPNKSWCDFHFMNKMTKPREDFIGEKYQEWFKKSSLKEELIANLWLNRKQSFLLKP